MKILIATDSYKFQTSGAANVIITMAGEFRKRGHDIKVLAMSNSIESFRDGDDYYIGSIPALVYPDVRMSLVRHDPLLEELIEWNPDLIHLHTEGSAERLAKMIAKETNTPIIMTAHTDYAQFLFGRFSNTPPAAFIARAWGKMTYRGVNTIIAPSEKALSFEQLKEFRDKTVVIPNGIKLEQFQQKYSKEEKEQLFKQYGLTDNGKTMVIVSRISREKNIKEILFYLPELQDKEPDIQLLIVGDGPEKNELENYCKRHGLSDMVRFTGMIPPQDVYRYYDMGDVFVSASTFEVHSLTYLEAMACGLPLVCRKDPCLKGVLTNGVNGFTFESGQEFADSVLSILTDGELRSVLSKNALQTAEQFTEQALADHTLALYKQVIRETKGEALEEDSSANSRRSWHTGND